MDYSFPADIQQRIDSQLASGTFTNENEVLRGALEALERRQSGLAQLREMIAVAEEDVAQGRFGAFSRDDIKQDLRRRFAERGISE